MIYREKKVQVRSWIEANFHSEFKDKSTMIDSITEKLLANEFNQTFYRGEGLTSKSFSYAIFRLGLKSWIRALIKGLGISGYTLVKVIQSKKSSQPIEDLGWVYTIPNQFFENRNKCTNLEKYLNSTLVENGIRPPTKYFVQSGSLKNTLRSKRLEVVPHIGSRILCLENQSKLKCSFEIIKRTLFWLKTSIRYPAFLLVGAEYIVEVPAIELRKSQKRDVLITTQSQLLAPAYVFKSSISAEKIMYWYSNNSVQLARQKKENLDYSYLIQPQISQHFVWSSSWGKILQEHNEYSVVIPIGPIIFEDLSGYSKYTQKKSAQTRNILIFDVTPKKNATSDSFYSDKEMQNFILDIVECIKSRCPDALIKLKPKRVYSSEDSVSYQDLLESQANNIKVLRWNCNIVREILDSDLVICVPFTSPALISQHLGVPTVFYSPSEDFNLGKINDGVLVLQGLCELQLFIKEFWESNSLNLKKSP